MGLFDFVKDIGEKIFGSDDDPAEKIKEHIESRNPGIKDLSVEFKDGQVNLSGDAASAEARGKSRTASWQRERGGRCRRR